MDNILFCTFNIEEKKKLNNLFLIFFTIKEILYLLKFNLEFKKYPIAIGLLSDHLHRNPADYEAYNLLIRCYYETDRYETAMELSKMLMEANPTLPCFANNYFIAFVLNSNGKSIPPKSESELKNNPFIEYNFSVINENEKSHSFKKSPTLKSKLLFMDYQFNTIKANTI